MLNAETCFTYIWVLLHTFCTSSQLFCAFLFLLLDLWANPDFMPEGAFWVQVHADWSKLVQLLLWSTNPQGTFITKWITTSTPNNLYIFLFPWGTACALFSCRQVALLDFGATRGFDKNFTDAYIEVRNCTTVKIKHFTVTFKVFLLFVSLYYYMEHVQQKVSQDIEAFVAGKVDIVLWMSYVVQADI